MRHKDWLLPVIVLVAPVALYWPTLHGWFIGDDYAFTPILTMSAKAVMQCLQMVHNGELRLHPFRPVAFASFWLDYRIWGWNSFGFHLTNTLLHSCNALLIWFLARALKMPRYGALVSSLFYGLYPGHSEPVIWISCRFDLLSQTFFLASLLFWISGRRRSNSILMVLSATTYLLSLFTKETIAGGIVLFPLVDWLFLRDEPERPGRPRFWLGWLGAQLLALATLTVTRLWLYGNVTGDVGRTRGQQFCGTPFVECVSRLWQDLWMLVTPVSRLIFSEFTVSVVGVLIFVLLAAAIYASLVAAAKRDFLPLKLLLLGIVWIFSLVIPTLFVDPVVSTLSGSRFLYAPCTGLALIMGLTAWPSLTRYGRIVLTLFAVWLLVSTIILLQYNNATYIESGKIVKGVDQVIFDNTQDIQDGDTIVVVNMPFFWKGAFFAPNGYSAYLQWIHQRRHLNLAYIQKDPKDIDSWWSGLQQSPNRHYYGFIWNASQQTLEPLH